jgi:hypothetical protein
LNLLGINKVGREEQRRHCFCRYALSPVRFRRGRFTVGPGGANLQLLGQLKQASWGIGSRQNGPTQQHTHYRACTHGDPARNNRADKKAPRRTGGRCLETPLLPRLGGSRSQAGTNQIHQQPRRRLEVIAANWSLWLNPGSQPEAFHPNGKGVFFSASEHLATPASPPTKSQVAPEGRRGTSTSGKPGREQAVPVFTHTRT